MATAKITRITILTITALLIAACEDGQDEGSTDQSAETDVVCEELTTEELAAFPEVSIDRETLIDFQQSIGTLSQDWLNRQNSRNALAILDIGEGSLCSLATIEGAKLKRALVETIVPMSLAGPQLRSVIDAVLYQAGLRGDALEAAKGQIIEELVAIRLDRQNAASE